MGIKIYLIEYRKLNKKQLCQLHMLLKLYFDPKNNEYGNKILSRSYHNRKN